MKSRIGVDEVGRGPIAGPLCVCALRLTTKSGFDKEKNIKDSKQLSEKQRLLLFRQIEKEKREGRLSYALAYVSSGHIDTIGMSHALTRAVSHALHKLVARTTDIILLDGALYAPKKFEFQKTIIKGDETEIAIALASVVAKVSRDKRMISLSKKYPEYGFESHKGYGTRAHYQALARYGFSPVHRRSFCKNVKFY